MAQYVTISYNTTLCFFLGNKLYGNIICYIRGQHEVLKVKIAERRTFMTHVLTIDEIHYM